MILFFCANNHRLGRWSVKSFSVEEVNKTPIAIQQIELLNEQLLTAQDELKKPFIKENELNEKTARLTQLNIELNLEQEKKMEEKEEHNENEMER